VSRFPVSWLRSVDLEVPDLDAAEHFYTQAWGLDVAAREATSLYLRATGDDHHILALHAGAKAAMRSITFRADSVAALHDVAARAGGHGGRVLMPVGPVAWMAGGTGVVILDNQGRTLRVVHGDARRTADAPVRDRASRLSHVNINSSDTEAARAWYESVLGFRMTDRSRLMAFVRCNDDHHCIVIADAPVDGLNHVAFMLPDLEGVMRAAGRMVDHGYPIGWGVGRHGPGDNVFAYFVDPFGIVVEHTAEVLKVDDAYRVGGPQDWTWPPGRTDQWGIAPPKSEAVKQAQLAILFTPPEAAP
jgi:catechol-2,3-dioxygenase